MNKKTLILMRGGISRCANIFGGIGMLTLLFGNIFGGVFLFVLPANAGGVAGEVIDYTLLEQLQAEYGTTTPPDLYLPQISATTTKLDATRQVSGLKIENNAPNSSVSKIATSTISEFNGSLIIFALALVALLIFIYWRYRRNGGGKNNGQAPPEDLRQNKLPL